MDAILCIDDAPERYDRLAMWLTLKGVPVLVTHNPADVEFYLERYRIVGTCLDYDMPTREGHWFVGEYGLELTKPFITSLNPSGARRMRAQMKDLGEVAYVMPCTTTDWEQVALRFWGLPLIPGGE